MSASIDGVEMTRRLICIETFMRHWKYTGDSFNWLWCLCINKWNSPVWNGNMETQSKNLDERWVITFLKTTFHAGMWCSRPSQCWGSLVMRLNISSIKNTIPDILVPARAGKHTQLQIVLSPIERKYLTGWTNPINESKDKTTILKPTVVGLCPGY